MELTENSGREFDDTQLVDLDIQEIRLDGCSALHEAPKSENGTKPLFRTGMYVHPKLALIANSTGNGLTMFNDDAYKMVHLKKMKLALIQCLKRNLWVLDYILIDIQ